MFENCSLAPFGLESLWKRLSEEAWAVPKLFRFDGLYDNLYQTDVLTVAYRLCRYYNGAPGVDGQTFDDIERYGRKRWLEELALALRDEKYRPEAIKRVFIPKANGELRPLGLSNIRDRVCMMAAVLLLHPIFEEDLAQDRYVKYFFMGRNMRAELLLFNIGLCNGYQEVVGADLSAYFDTIPHSELMLCIARRVSDRKVLGLIKSWLECAVEEIDPNGRRTRTTVSRDTGQGIPYGAPISALLANLYMWRFVYIRGRSGRVQLELARAGEHEAANAILEGSFRVQSEVVRRVAVPMSVEPEPAVERDVTKAYIHLSQSCADQSIARELARCLIAELEDALTPPMRRLQIGDRLAELGDPRPGVGLDDKGLPDIDWVHVPAGPFLYGEEKETRELPDFFIARHPVTNEQYQAFIDADGYDDVRWWPDSLPPRRGKSLFPEPNRPRVGLLLDECVAYCRWLSDRLGYEVRLPTELEWEKAARGIDGREYPWGDGYREGYANLCGELISESDEHLREKARGTHDGRVYPSYDGYLPGCPKLCVDYLIETSAVGLFLEGASPYGILDMSGNVRERCLNDHSHPFNGYHWRDGRNRVWRGGGYRSEPEACRAYRASNEVPVSLDDVGFRVCCGFPH